MMRCTGCGSTETIEEIQRHHPNAISCCPERDMQPVSIEAAHFRDLLDSLFHAMPITNDMSEGTRMILGKLRQLTYKDGKQGVIDARAFLTKLEADCN